MHNGEVAYASNAGKLNGLASEAYIQPQDDMLINSNWQYGYVNQKGQTRYNTDGYCLDNWRTYNTDVIINSGSINIKSKAQDSYKHFSQKTEHTLKAGNVYTITMLAKINSAENAFFRPSTKQLSGITGTSGLKLTAGSKFELYSYTFIPTEDVESGTLDFIAGNGASHNYDIDLAAVKLEPGPRFTGWPVWNYALELAKCQRYALEMVSASNNEHGKVGIGNVLNETTAVIFCPTPVSLRTTPSASFAGNFRLVESGRWDDGIPVTSINANHVTTNGISLYVNTTGGLHVGKCYELVFSSSERNSLLLNANL